MENFYSQNNYNNMYNNNMYNNEREKIRQSKFFKDCMKKILIDIIVWACVGILYISIAYVGYLNDIRSLAFFGAGFFWLLIYVIIRKSPSTLGFYNLHWGAEALSPENSKYRHKYC